jgi:hypothetical protein
LAGWAEAVQDLYVEAKQLPLALAAYQEAAAGKPGSPEAVHARLLAGKLYQTELGDYGAALAQYSTMDRASLSADDREALMSLEADCHLRMGDLAKAAASFDALAAESADPEAKERAALRRRSFSSSKARWPRLPRDTSGSRARSRRAASWTTRSTASSS